MKPRAKLTLNIPEGTVFFLNNESDGSVSIDNQKAFMIRIPAEWVREVEEGEPDNVYSDAAQHHSMMGGGQ